MIKHLCIKSCVFVCLFVLSLTLPLTVVKNANAKEYQEEISVKLITSEGQVEKVQLVQLEELEKQRNEKMIRRMDKKMEQFRAKREKAMDRKLKDQAPMRSFLEGGPTTLRVPLSPSNKINKKDKKQPLRLPTWDRP
jgi:hypothetical protein